MLVYNMDIFRYFEVYVAQRRSVGDMAVTVTIYIARWSRIHRAQESCMRLQRPDTYCLAASGSGFPFCRDHADIILHNTLYTEGVRRRIKRYSGSSYNVLQRPSNFFTCSHSGSVTEMHQLRVEDV